MAEDLEFASAIHKRYNFCEGHRPVTSAYSKCAQCEINRLWDFLEQLQDANAQLKLELAQKDDEIDARETLDRC